MKHSNSQDLGLKFEAQSLFGGPGGLRKRVNYGANWARGRTHVKHCEALNDEIQHMFFHDSRSS